MKGLTDFEMGFPRDSIPWVGVWGQSPRYESAEGTVQREILLRHGGSVKIEKVLELLIERNAQDQCELGGRLELSGFQ